MITFLILAAWAFIGWYVAGHWFARINSSTEQCGTFEITCLVVLSGPFIWFCAAVALILLVMDNK